MPVVQTKAPQQVHGILHTILPCLLSLVLVRFHAHMRLSWLSTSPQDPCDLKERAYPCRGWPAMPRPVLQTCGKLRVEVRPLALHVFRWPDYDKAKPLQISRGVSPTLSAAHTTACSGNSS